MQSYFYDLADHVTKSLLKQKEVYSAYFSAETSDFCRLNGARVRQAGSVRQLSLALRLIKDGRSVDGLVTLTGGGDDKARVASLLTELRGHLAAVPVDPHLLYATEVHSSEKRGANELPESSEAVADIIKCGAGLDMVGIYAAGGIYRGFANSFGQRNWHEAFSFNLDWSFYLRADKAVKTGYAGFSWDAEQFQAKVEQARVQLAALGKEAKTVKPGPYRVYLAPAALGEVTGMLGWGGFSLRAHRTKQTSLLRMAEGGTAMHRGVHFSEDTAGGLDPDFSPQGFARPKEVKLIAGGQLQSCLVSPRSAKEYSVPTNGALDEESPQSLALAAGSLSMADAAKLVQDGIYINNLWYLNYSDRPACRVTGMTRFASFWVEKGQIARPLNVMRFDDSVLKMLGDKLVGLTAERELMPSASTYNGRATTSAHLPGAVVDGVSFTL